jgi:hypothetical protein
MWHVDTGFSGIASVGFPHGGVGADLDIMILFTV